MCIPNENDMAEYDAECIKADRDTKEIIQNSVFNALKDGEIGAFEERAVAVTKYISETNMHPEFAGWMAGLDPNLPEHQGVIDAGEHFLYFIDP